MEKDKLKALKRLLPTLSEEEAYIVKQKFEAGQPTGYATVDRPGDEYYKDVEKMEWGIDSPKFLFQITVDGEIIFNYGTDDRNEILKLAEGIEF